MSLEKTFKAELLQIFSNFPVKLFNMRGKQYFN